MIRKLLDHMLLEEVLQRRLQQWALRQRGGSAAGNMVSAVRYCERLRLIRPIVIEVHWLAVKAVDRVSSCNAKSRIWTTARDLETLGTAYGHWAWERLFFAGLLPVIYFLRLGDLESLGWCWLGTKGWFTCHDEKVNGQDTLYPLSEYMDLWRAHIYAQRRPEISPAPMVGRNQYGSITPEKVGGGEKGEKG